MIVCVICTCNYCWMMLPENVLCSMNLHSTSEICTYVILYLSRLVRSQRCMHVWCICCIICTVADYVNMCWCDTCHLLNLARYGSDVSVCSEQFYHYRLLSIYPHLSVQTLIMHIVGAALIQFREQTCSLCSCLAYTLSMEGSRLTLVCIWAKGL